MEGDASPARRRLGAQRGSAFAFEPPISILQRPDLLHSFCDISIQSFELDND